MSNATAWKNRIVGHGDVAPDQLLASPFNFRVHPAAQQAALADSIGSLGYIRSVTVSQRTGTVIDGHLRVTLALRNNEPTIPVEFVDLTEDEERQALLLLDPIAALAVTDQEKRAETLAALTEPSPALTRLLESLGREPALPHDDPPDWQRTVCPACGHVFEV